MTVLPDQPSPSGPAPGTSALLPRFAAPRRPPIDPPPAETTPETPARGRRARPAGPDELSSLSVQGAGGSAGAPDDPPPLSVGPEKPRTTSSTGSGWSSRLGRGSGDPQAVAALLGGLLIVATRTLDYLAGRRGRGFRQPTPDQRDGVALPLARIAVRHLPLGALGPDFADATAAVYAADDYLRDGPMLTWPADAGEIPPQEDQL